MGSRLGTDRLNESITKLDESYKDLRQRVVSISTNINSAREDFHRIEQARMQDQENSRTEHQAPGSGGEARSVENSTSFFFRIFSFKLSPKPVFRKNPWNFAQCKSVKFLHFQQLNLTCSKAWAKKYNNLRLDAVWKPPLLSSPLPSSTNPGSGQAHTVLRNFWFYNHVSNKTNYKLKTRLYLFRFY